MKLAELPRWRKTLVVVGLLFVVLEVADAFRIEETAFALGFAAVTLLAIAWAWTQRAGGRIGGPVLLILLAAMELMGIFFFYPAPDTPLVWADYTVFALLSVGIIASAIGAILESRKG